MEKIKKLEKEAAKPLHTNSVLVPGHLEIPKRDNSPEKPKQTTPKSPTLSSPTRQPPAVSPVPKLEPLSSLTIIANVNNLDHKLESPKSVISPEKTEHVEAMAPSPKSPQTDQAKITSPLKDISKSPESIQTPVGIELKKPAENIIAQEQKANLNEQFPKNSEVMEEQTPADEKIPLGQLIGKTQLEGGPTEGLVKTVYETIEKPILSSEFKSAISLPTNTGRLEEIDEWRNVSICSHCQYYQSQRI